MSFVADDLVAQQRFESFRLGGGAPAHSRSHSRSSGLSFSMPSSTSTTPNDMPPVQPKRNSHHRRVSSVSTRHESVEILGLPDLPLPSSDDHHSGEKDSIRRKALWALEGKHDASYSKVEIPDLSASAEIDGKHSFDFPTRPSFPAGSGISSSMTSKRDSFKLLTSANKDILGTLVEEEEEDEDCGALRIRAPPVTPLTPITPEAHSFRAKMAAAPMQASRPRPSPLRPLSLTPESFDPPPSTSPSPRLALKSLSLVNGHSPTDDANANETSSTRSTPRRPVLNLQITAEPAPLWNSVVATPSSSASDSSTKVPFRRSSMSYKSSQGNTNYAGLPTPEMTPTFSERRSSSAGSMSSRSSLSSTSNFDLGAVAEEESVTSASSTSHPSFSKHTSLSLSEQHFLFKSHNALIARITDLEKALSIRRRESFGLGSSPAHSRAVSVASDFSSNEPSDEMLRLVADLKAERDELKRDVEGWRTRVSDLEKQIAVFVKRVEVERRDAWLARSKLGLLEVEKGNLTRESERAQQTVQELEEKLYSLESENAQLVEECDRLRVERGDVEEEVQRWMSECERLRSDLHDAERLEDSFDSIATPTPSAAKAFGRSAMDFEASGSPHAFGFSLKSTDGEQSDEEEDDNGLANYEDEQEGDMTFYDSSSSAGSLNEFPRSIEHLNVRTMDFPVSPITPLDSVADDRIAIVGSREPSPASSVSASSTAQPSTPSPTVPPRPTHQLRASLSKTWTFPKPAEVKSIPAAESVDRFFGCMDEDSPDTAIVAVDFTYEHSKSLFTRGLNFGNDSDDIPFFGQRDTTAPTLPPLSPSIASSNGLLDVVVEEEEEEEDEQAEASMDEEDMFGDVGGIKITFTPPQAGDDELLGNSLLTETLEEEDDDDDDALPMVFSIVGQKVAPAPVPLITPPRSVGRTSSGIPRATRPSPPSPEIPSTVPKLHSPNFAMATSTLVYSTPPSKRGGVMPSFIPQPIASPLSSKPSSPTFQRQPLRKPLMSTNNGNGPRTSNGQAFRPQPFVSYPTTPQSIKRPGKIAPF